MADHKMFFFLLGGEATLGIPERMTFGTIYGDEVDDSGNYLTGHAPFRTIVMLIGLVTHISIRYLYHNCFDFA